MVELLQLIEAGLTVTAVTLAAVTLPVAVVTDSELPDIYPINVECLRIPYMQAIHINWVLFKREWIIEIFQH